MTLTYKDKLRIFHDTFVTSVWSYIDRQRALELGHKVPVMTTLFRDKIETFKIIPIVREGIDLAFVLNDLWNGGLYSSTSVSVNVLFPFSDIKIKQILSKAIQEIAVHVENHLSRLQNFQEVGVFATDAVIKFISYIKQYPYYVGNGLTVEGIVGGILQQNGWFTNDRFLIRELTESENYHFISEDEAEQYTINDEMNNSSILTKFDQHITFDNQALEKKQIVIVKGGKETSFPRYTTLNNNLFSTDIDSLRIGILEEHNKILQQHIKQPNQLVINFDNVRGGIDNFIGRTSYLENIFHYFESHDGGIQVIAGLGGVGKTQIALRYVNDHKKEYDYRVRWIVAEDESSLQRSFREFAEDLSIDVKKIDSDKVIRLVLERLEKKVEKTLLIFDNVLDKRILSKYLPSLKASQKHDVIITTINVKDWIDNGTSKQKNIIELAPFSQEEAARYIEKTLGINSIDQIEKLSALFSYLPLGISQSAAFIRSTEISIAEYLQEYEQKKHSRSHVEMHDLSLEDDDDFAHINNIYITLEIILERVLVTHPVAHRIIKLCSYLRTESIPISMFNNLFLYESDKKKAISVLKGFSLIFGPVDENQYVNTHRIIQEVLIMQTSTEEKINDIRNLAQNIVKQRLFTRDNTTKQKYENNKKYLLHVESIIENAKKLEVELDPELIYLVLSRAVYYDFNRDHLNAKEQLLSLKKILKDMAHTAESLSIEEFASQLAEKDQRIPTLYAQICYHLGKSYLSLSQELAESEQYDESVLLSRDAKKSFEEAVAVRAIIDSSQELYDDIFNEGINRPMDSTIFQRQGILLWYKSQQSEESTELALEGYGSLIKQELAYDEEDRDHFNLETCRRLVLECMDQKTEIDNSQDLSVLYGLLENVAVNLGIKLDENLTEVNERKLLAEKIFKALEVRTQEYIRIARDYNLVGKIFLKIYSATQENQDRNIAKKFVERAKILEGAVSEKSFIFSDANKILEHINRLENKVALEKSDIANPGDLVTSEQISALLQIIKENSGAVDKIDFTASITEENIESFIERTALPEEIVKIHFGVINIHSDNDQDNKHWVSYVQVPNTYDISGEVVGVRSIIINSAGSSYSLALDRIKSKIENVFLNKQIQITLPIRNLDYQTRDVELYQDWNTCGVWVCQFFEELVLKSATLVNIVELKFDEILSYTNIHEKRREYSDLLRALASSVNDVVGNKGSDNIFYKSRIGIDKILTIMDTSFSSSEEQFRKKSLISSEKSRELLEIIKQNSHSPILEQETLEAEKIRYEKLVSSFTQLGEIFIHSVEEETLIENKIKALIEASKFFNYAINIAKKHSLDSRSSYSMLEYINSELIFISGGTTPHAQSALTNYLKDNSGIQELRDFSREKLGDLESLSDEGKVIRARELFENISERMKEFLARLFKESEAILGKAPCKYSVIGLGSMALKTITPYSDFEFAIIIEKESPEIKEYFKKLTQLVHFRIINLGETVIPESELGGCNTDHLINRGVSFDLGGKTPLGREDKNYNLIHGIEGMLHYLKNEEDKIEHIDKNLPYILEVSDHVYGDMELHRKYVEQAQRFIFDEVNSEGFPNHKFRAVKRLKDGVVEYDYDCNNRQLRHYEGDLNKFAPSILKIHGALDNLFDAKQDIYRVSDRILYNLSLLFGYKVNSAWEIRGNLQNTFQSIIDNYKPELIDYMIMYANCLRLRVYLKYNSQLDNIYIYDYRILDIRESFQEAKPISDSLFYFTQEDLSESSSLFKFYYISMPLYEFLVSYFKSDMSIEVPITYLSGMSNFYDDSKMNMAMVYFRLGMYEVSKKILEELKDDRSLDDSQIFLLERFLSYTYFFTKEPDKAIDFFRHKNYGDQVGKLEDTVSRAFQENRKITLYLPNKGRDYNFDSDSDDGAVEIYPGSVEYPTIESVVNVLLGNRGVDGFSGSSLILREKGEFDEAIRQDLIALEFEIDVTSKSGIMNNIGISYQKKGDFSKAIQWHLKSLEINKIFQNGINLNVANSLNSLGYCYRKLGQLDEALQSYLRAAEIQQTIYKGKVHSDTIESIRSIGVLYLEKEDYYKAIEMFKKCYDMFKILHNNIPHPDMCETIDSIAHAYYLIDDYVNALKNSIESFKIIFSFLANHSYQTKNTQEVFAINLSAFCEEYSLEINFVTKLVYREVISRGAEFASAITQTYYGEIFYNENELDNSIACFKMALIFNEGLEEYQKTMILNTLARIYNLKAIQATESDNLSIANEYISMAHEYFKKAIKDSSLVNDVLRLEYANFLIFLSEFDRAFQLILEVLSNDSSTEVSYSKNEAPMLIEELQYILCEVGSIRVYSTELAYFFIIRYYEEFQNNPNIKSKEEYLFRFDYYLENEQGTMVGKHLLESLLNGLFSEQIEEKMQNFYSFLAEHGAELREMLSIGIEDSEQISIEISNVLAKEEAQELVEIIKSNIYPSALSQEASEAEKIRYEKLVSSFSQIGKILIREAEEVSASKESKIDVLIAASKFFNYAIDIAIKNDIDCGASLTLIEYINFELFSLTESVEIPSQSILVTKEDDKREIEILREYAKSVIREVESLSDEDNVVKIGALFENIAEKMKEFLAKLFKESEAILGDAPCKYSVIGLGSMALKTMTPYSDLEFAIIVEKKSLEIKEYFKKLTQLVHFRIVNLGETVIPESELGGCNTDHLVNRGISFDLGGKTPLGREDKNYDLIQTIDGMLHYLRNIEDKIERIDENLPYILELSDHVYGSIELHKTYVEQVQKFLFEEVNFEGVPNCEARAIKKLQENSNMRGGEGDVSKYRAELLNQEDEDRAFDVKREIYRIPDRMLYNMLIYSGKFFTNMWEAVENLKIDGIASEMITSKLLHAFSFANWLRLKTYMYHGAQKEFIDYLSILKHIKADHLSAEIAVEDSLFQFYEAAIFLHIAINKLTNSDINIFKMDEVFFQDNEAIKGGVYKRLGLYDKALYWFKIADQKLIDNIDVKRSISQILLTRIGTPEANLEAVWYSKRCVELSSPDNFHIYMTDLILALKACGNLQEAKVGIIKLLELEQRDSEKAVDYMNLALIEKELNEFNDAEQNFVRSLEILQPLPETLGNLLAISNVKMNQGDLYLLMQKFEHAEKVLKESLEIRQKYKGESSIAAIEVSINLANCYLGMGNLNTAKELYLKLLDQLKEKQIFALNSNMVISIKNNLAIVLEKENKSEEALKIHMENLEMRKDLFGTYSSEVAQSYDNIASIYIQLGKKLLSVEFLQKSIEIHTKNNNLLKLQQSLTGLACIKSELGDYSSATKFFELSLSNMNQLSGLSVAMMADLYLKFGLHELRFDNDLRAKELFDLASNTYREHGGSSDALEELLDLLSYDQVQTINTETHQRLFNAAISVGAALRAVKHLEILLNTLDNTQCSEKIMMLCSLGSLLNISAKRFMQIDDLQQAELNILKADTYFRQAMDLEFSLSASAEYINFLISNGEFKRAFSSLENLLFKYQEDVLKYGEEILVYSSMEKIIIPRTLYKVIEEGGGSVRIKAIELAYYLLLHHYEDFKKIAELKPQLEYLQNFQKVLSSSAGYYLYADIIEERGLENNVFLSTDKGLKLLDMVKGILSEETFKLFLEFCSRKYTKEQMFPESDEQEFRQLLKLFEETADEVTPSDSKVFTNHGDKLLEKIDKIKDFVGTKELSNFPGFYQYVVNSLSNNHLSKSASRVIEIVDDLVSALEKLIDLSLSHNKIEQAHEDVGISLWTQLEYLFEFTASGQRFIGAKRPPYFDSGDDAYGGGSSFGGAKVSGDENITYSEYIVLPLNGTVLSNNTFESDI